MGHLMQPEVILNLLRSSPIRLVDLPKGPGLYGLYDHNGSLRYIGETSMGIRRRVYNYHCAGDGNSHKYSSYYNVGRLYHSRKDPLSDGIAGKLAKGVRAQFARRFCRAVGVALLGRTSLQLKAIEKQIVCIARPTEIEWNGSRQIPTSERTLHFEKLIDSLELPVDQMHALDKQAERWKNLQAR